MKTYFTGKPCKYGHVSERYVVNRTCVECCNSYSVTWAKNNKDYALEKRRENYKANSEHYKNVSKSWRRVNKEKCRIQWSARDKRLKQATPKWLSEKQFFEIESFYWLAKLQNQLNDMSYNVDHIIPLHNKSVCGLHVPWNLQILEESANKSKSNKLILAGD